jgi:hypothetical protein
MAAGVIRAKKGTGDVYFLDSNGKQVLPPSKKLSVNIEADFHGGSLKEAIAEAAKYASGALRNYVNQKTSGHQVFVVAKNIKIDYEVRYGFK